MKSEYTLSVGTIEHNLEAVKAEVEQRTQELAGTIVTPDNIKDSKKFLTEIRKEKKVLDDERKEIKKVWMKPFEAFETKVKEVIALYDVPINAINGQLKEYEEQEKEHRKETVLQLYDEIVPQELREYVPFDRIFRPRWLNATATVKAISDDIATELLNIRSAIETVSSFESEWEEKALETLKVTGDLKLALNKMQELQKQADYIRELESVATESVAHVEEAFVEGLNDIPETPAELIYYSVDVPKYFEEEFLQFCEDHNLAWERM